MMPEKGAQSAPEAPTPVQRAEASPAFRKAFQALEDSGVFAEFAEAIRLDTWYCEAMAKAAHNQASRLAAAQARAEALRAARDEAAA